MELLPFFRSALEQDRAAVVMCDLEHRVIYMNPAAKERYKNSGGAELVGKSLLLCHGAESRVLIERVLEWFKKSTENNTVYTYHNGRENKDVYMVALRGEGGRLIGYYEKHEYRDRETMPLYGI